MMQKVSVEDPFVLRTGIMWQTILCEKGLSVSYLQFTKTTIVIAVPVLIVTLLSLALVV